MLSDEELRMRVVERLSRHDSMEGWSLADDVLCSA